MLRLLLRVLFSAVVAGLMLFPVFAGAGTGDRLGVVEGQLVEVHADVVGADPIPGYVVEDGTTAVPLSGEQPGTLVGQEVAVDDTSNRSGLQGAAEPTSDTRLVAAEAARPRKTAVVMVNFANNTTQPVTADALRARVFSGSDSVNQFYQDQSGGSVSLTGITNTAGDVLGWWTLPMPQTTTCSTQSMMDMRTAARNYATAHAVNLDAYDHVVVYFPRNSACGWAGLGETPGKWSWINGYNYTSVIAHEMGHNMGVHHASTISCGSVVLASTGCSTVEYGDQLDVMGQSSTLMSAWHRAQLGQLPVAARRTVEHSGSFTIDSVDDPVADDPRLLLIPRTVAGRPVTEYFAVEIRSNSGVFDAFGPTSTAVTGVSLRLVPALSVISQSRLLDAHPATRNNFSDAPLQPGETFTDPLSGLKILNTVSGSGTATVTVTLAREPDTTAPTAPTVTATPTDTGVVLRWTAATDNVGVTGYEIRRNDAVIATAGPATRTFTDLRVAGMTSATYHVVALDGSGNRTPSAAVTTPVPDITAPRLASVQAVRGENGDVTVRSSATDDRGVTGYLIAWYGGSTSSETSEWTHIGTTKDAIIYTVRAIDASGNASDPVSVTVAAVPVPPVVTPPGTTPPKPVAPKKPIKVKIAVKKVSGRVAVTITRASKAPKLAASRRR